MARPGPQTQAKRRREQLKKDKRKAKDEKKALRKAMKKEQDVSPQDSPAATDGGNDQPISATRSDTDTAAGALAADMRPTDDSATR